MKTMGSFKYTFEAMEVLQKDLRRQLERFEPNPIMEDLLEILFNFKKEEGTVWDFSEISITLVLLSISWVLIL